MANYVFNSLSVITKTKEELDQFLEKMATPYSVAFQTRVINEATGQVTTEIVTETRESEFSFNNIVPAPIGTDEYDEVKLPGGAISQGWYDWNINNWGTKWDAGDVYADRADDTHMVYSFSTAWSPPMPVMHKLAEQYPNFDISFSYEEEQGWGGECESPAGLSELLETQSWDIPDSHIDHISRDRTCNCESETDQTYWYDDCPREDA